MVESSQSWGREPRVWALRTELWMLLLIPHTPPSSSVMLEVSPSLIPLLQHWTHSAQVKHKDKWCVEDKEWIFLLHIFWHFALVTVKIRIVSQQQESGCVIALLSLGQPPVSCVLCPVSCVRTFLTFCCSDQLWSAFFCSLLDHVSQPQLRSNLFLVQQEYLQPHQIESYTSLNFFSSL